MTVLDSIERTRFNRILEFVPSGRVLDAGGGDGAFSHFLAERGREVVLVDRELPPHRLDPVRTMQSDICALPLADGSFDAVCAMRVLHQVGDWELAFEECVRVTRPGGRLVFEAIPEDPVGPEEMWTEIWRHSYELAGLRMPVYRPGIRALLEFASTQPSVQVVAAQRISLLGTASVEQVLGHLTTRIQRRGGVLRGGEEALRTWALKRCGDLTSPRRFTRRLALVILDRTAG